MAIVMDNQEIGRLLDSMPSTMRNIKESMERYASDEIGANRAIKKLFGFIPSGEANADMFNAFRDLPWFLSAFEDVIEGVRGVTFVLRPKKYLEDSIRVCYHVTSHDMLGRIGETGIRNGIDCGAPLRDRKWLDAAHYIHVAITQHDAEWWAGKLFPTDAALIVPISMTGMPVLRLFEDPGSTNPVTGKVNGFIVDAVAIPPSLIAVADVYRVEPAQ